MPGETELVLKGISIVKDVISKGQGGVSYTSDQITYPHDLERVDEDVVSKMNAVASIGKTGALFSDAISFYVHGEFRAYDQPIENDPNSLVMPVMANVYVDLQSSEKATLTELEIHFTALQTPFGTADDPRIRFLCEGHYDPAGTGDTRFRAVVEIDQNAKVNVIEQQKTGGDGALTDESPNGFSLTIEDC
jgi:hypothetical protein